MRHAASAAGSVGLLFALTAKDLRPRLSALQMLRAGAGAFFDKSASDDREYGVTHGACNPLR